MPVSREIAEDVSRELVALYGEAEQRLAATIATQLSAGMDTPDWASDKLAGLGRLRRSAQTIVRRLERDVEGAAFEAVGEAYARGGTAALDELIRAGRLTRDQRDTISRALPGAATAQQLATSLAGRLTGTHLPVLRWAEDSYRAVVASVSSDIALGLATRRRTAQRAWEQLLDRGITGFTDRAGRRWNLATYVEMAARTGVAQAAVEGHLDRLSNAGVDLVIVSNAPLECARCRRWEGRVLSRSGENTGRIRVPHATRDETIRITVAGSVDEAVAAGLLHPQCRHSLSMFSPGITEQPEHTADPEGEKAREKLRALERKVRRAKLKAGAAIDPAAGKAARARVRDLQSQIRDHVAATDHLGVRRKRYREQVDLGHRRPPAGQPAAPPPPPPPPTPAEHMTAGRFAEAGLTQVGGQSGSNRGGLFRDGDGNEWYIKASLSEEHAKTEALAGDLYRAAGIQVPDVVPGRGAPGLGDGPQIASRIVGDARQDLAERLDDTAYLDQLRDGFAVDAWLANWDVAGVTFDNIVSAGGAPVRIDLGGALTFRAQGAAKGAAFGDEVMEWTTLRDPNIALQAARLFEAVTARQRVESAEHVRQVTPADIRRLVAARGLGDDLAARLIARREDLLTRAKQDEAAVRFEARAEAALSGQQALDSVPLRKEGPIRPLPEGWDPAKAEAAREAARWYQGSGYQTINATLRGESPGAPDARKAIEHLRDVLDQSHLPSDVLAWRGFSRGNVVFGSEWQAGKLQDVEITEAGFFSTSASRDVSAGFAGRSTESVLMRLIVPRGTRALYLTGSEQEILLAPGTRFRVVADHGMLDGRRLLDAEVIP